MRIIQWAFPFLPVQGGREVLIDTLSRQLVEMGHQVLVVTDTPPESSEINAPYKVFRFEANELSSLISTVESFNPDVIHVHNYLHNSILLLMQLAALPRIVVTFHNEHIHSDSPIAKSRYLWLRENAICIIAISEFVKRSIEQSNDFFGLRLETIYNGTPLINSAQELGHNLLFLGRLVPEKGLGFLISSFYLTLQRHPNLCLNIVGDGPFRDSFEKLVTDLGIGKSVKFSGWQTGQELDESYMSARLVVVPSAWREPFGLIAIEAMMHARPILVTDRGGLPEIVDNGVNGFVVQPGDVLGLAARISQIFSDPKLALQLGLGGHAKAMREFSISTMSEKHLRIYTEAMP